MATQSIIRNAGLTSFVMVAFAANSLLCREALASGSIGAASFTVVRIASGALFLWLLVVVRQRQFQVAGDWISSAALFAYAAGFSFAYLTLSAGSGALLLFGAVQITMIAYGLWSGERLNTKQVEGALLAAAGLVWLVLPGVEAPSALGAVLMTAAGAGWGIYSLRGRGAREPTSATAGNFIRCVPFALILFLAANGREESWSAAGVAYAIASGAIASGLGYALWYAVLPALRATTAATVLLSVPVIAALGGVLLLEEALTLRFAGASLAVLGGLLLFILNTQRGRA
ncbi:DMT family transporter [Parahaliea maris]|uniref:DMT family transporter n=1 Tax=Parahaliea maris TaxID=2716870 RepID=A0A5C9A4Q4_9GAMM|nr:DMT family transporter [Parahaliea maris]TXS95855.1 DMT family transporter [Parahaliea maris]